MKRNLIFLLLFLFINPLFTQYPKYLYGIISYYGDEFAGKKTASGEIFNPNDYTAAHKSLPFGTEVLVENLENGRKVKVKINDRGPFVNNRVLDVSRKAAEELGFIKKGTTYAKITILKIGDNKIIESEEISSESSSATVVVEPLSSSSSTSMLPKTENASISSSGVLSSAGLSYVSAITQTNNIYITNVVLLTNVVNLPPYTDKIVEGEIKEKDVGDEFIMEEPEEILPSLTSSSSGFSSSISVSSSNSSSSASSSSFIQEKEVIIDYTSPKEKVEKTELVVLSDGKRYFIQVGAFLKEKNALRVYELLRKEKYPVFTTEETSKNNRWIKVRIGYYNTREEAEKVLTKLKDKKLNGMILISR
jgi:rare lipoprotein A